MPKNGSSGKKSSRGAATGVETGKELTPEDPRADTNRVPRGCNTGCDIGPQDPEDRADTARDVRVAAAEFERAMPIPNHPCNRDEERYQNQNFFASFTKGLPHDDNFGEVIPEAYCKLLKALSTGKPRDFEKIELGCPGKPAKLGKKPQAAVAATEQASRALHINYFL